MVFFFKKTNYGLFRIENRNIFSFILFYFPKAVLKSQKRHPRVNADTVSSVPDDVSTGSVHFANDSGFTRLSFRTVQILKSPILERIESEIDLETAVDVGGGGFAVEKSVIVGKDGEIIREHIRGGDPDVKVVVSNEFSSKLLSF